MPTIAQEVQILMVTALLCRPPRADTTFCPKVAARGHSPSEAALDKKVVSVPRANSSAVALYDHARWSERQKRGVDTFDEFISSDFYRALHFTMAR